MANRKNRFLQNWLNEQVGVKAMVRDIKQRLPQYREHFAEFPEALFKALQEQKQINFRLAEINESLKAQNSNANSRFLVLSISAIVICGAFLEI